MSVWHYTDTLYRICHVKLFKKLLDRNIPAVIIRFLINVYLVQTANVRWGGVLSDAFAVSNGVKQGGISSPILFCVYVDGLLRRLKEAKLGCHIGREYVGALAYADDFTLLAPTADAICVICSSYVVSMLPNTTLLTMLRKAKWYCLDQTKTHKRMVGLSFLLIRK